MPNKMNNVQKEFLENIRSFWLWITWLGILFGGQFTHILHLPEIPQKGYYLLLLLPVIQNLWKQVVIPVSGFVWEIVQMILEWVILPIISAINILIPECIKRRLEGPTAIILIALLMFYEEILAKPFSKIALPIVRYIIKVLPPWAIVTVFVTLKLAEKFYTAILFIALKKIFTLEIGFAELKDLGIYIAMITVSTQILLQSSDEMMQYGWYRKGLELYKLYIEPIKNKLKETYKSSSLYQWMKKNKENKNTFFARVTARVKSWRSKKAK